MTLSSSKTAQAHKHVQTGVGLMLFIALLFAISNQYLSQAGVLLAVLLSIPFCLRGKQTSKSTTLWLFSLCFVAIAAIPSAIQSDSMRPMDAPLRYALLALLFLALPRFRLSRTHILSAASAATCLAVGAVFLFGLNEAAHTSVGGETRYNFGLGILDSSFASVLLIPPMWACLLLHRGQLLWQGLAVTGLTCATVIIIMSGSRVAWIAALLMPLLVFTLLYRRQWKALLAMYLVLSVAILLSYKTIPLVQQRVADAHFNISEYMDAGLTHKQNSWGVRMDLWKVSWQTFQEHPFFGAGYPQRAAIMRNMISQGEVGREIGEDGKVSSHNELLNAMSQKGMLGLVSILLLYLVPFFYFYRRAKLPGVSYEEKVIASAGVASVAGIALCGLAEAPLMSGRIAVIYALLIILLHRLCEQASGSIDEHQR